MLSFDRSHWDSLTLTVTQNFSKTTFLLEILKNTRNDLSESYLERSGYASSLLNHDNKKGDDDGPSLEELLLQLLFFILLFKKRRQDSGNLA